MYTKITEEEKKTIAPLLGKLYISPYSAEEKIRDLYEEISSAVEDNLLNDATGRNALFKIHVSLGKIVNQLNEQQQLEKSREHNRFRSSMSRSVTGSVADRSSVAGGSVAGDEKSAVEIMMDEKDATIMEEDGGDEDEKSVVSSSRGGGARKIKKEEISDEEDDAGDASDDTVRQHEKKKQKPDVDDGDNESLVEELLSDEDTEMSQD